MSKSETSELRTMSETAPFWEGTAAGKLMVKQCQACGQSHYYPRALCPHCLSADTEWRECSGNGVIHSVSVTRRGPKAPYALAYVKLDEGLAVLTNIIDCDLDALEIGQRVKIKFQAAEDGRRLPTFTPIGG